MSATTSTKPFSRPAIIAPSLLSCDLSNLAIEARTMMKLGADWMHMDIMDGHFVPNLTFGPPIISSLHSSFHTNPTSSTAEDSKKGYIDCHLMVTDPYQWIEPLRKAGASSITFHLESTLPTPPDNGDGISDPVINMINTIRNAQMNVGIVIKPSTPVERLFPYVDLLDVVLIMTVEPGFSGQSFMVDMVPKVQKLRAKFPNANIQVDGGISPETVDVVAQAGANVIVAASAIFNETTEIERKRVIDALRAGVEKYNNN